MRKLFLAAMLLLFLAGASQAAPSTAAVLDSTVVSLKVLLDFASVVAPESAVTTYKLWWRNGTTTTPTTLGTLPTPATFNGSKDTLTITGLYNGTQYYWEVRYWTQDTTTGSRHGHDYWIAVGAGGITKNIGQTVALITDSSAVDGIAGYGNYRNFRVSDVWLSDSVLVTLGMQYRLTGKTSTWTWATVQAHYGNAVGRDSVQLASPDTLCALSNGLTIDLLPGKTYDVRVIGYWGTAAAQAYRGSDTSNTLTVTTGNLPGITKLWDYPQGEIRPGVWHFKDSWNKLNHTWSSPHIAILGYKRLKIEVNKFGWDNNHPADSTKLWIVSDRPACDSGYVKIDSLLGTAGASWGVDTAVVVRQIALTPSERWTVGTDSVTGLAIGSEIWLFNAVKDSGAANLFGASLDTTTLDSLFLDIWVEAR